MPYSLHVCTYSMPMSPSILTHQAQWWFRPASFALLSFSRPTRFACGCVAVTHKSVASLRVSVSDPTPIRAHQSSEGTYSVAKLTDGECNCYVCRPQARAHAELFTIRVTVGQLTAEPTLTCVLPLFSFRRAQFRFSRIATRRMPSMKPGR